MKFIKYYNPSHTTNPCLLGKERVKKLCMKSYWLFKRKWAWRKLAELKGYTVDEIEREFDTVIEMQNQKIEAKMEARKNESKTNGTETRSEETELEPSTVRESDRSDQGT